MGLQPGCMGLQGGAHRARPGGYLRLQPGYLRLQPTCSSMRPPSEVRWRSSGRLARLLAPYEYINCCTSERTSCSSISSSKSRSITHVGAGPAAAAAAAAAVFLVSRVARSHSTCLRTASCSSSVMASHAACFVSRSARFTSFLTSFFCFFLTANDCCCCTRRCCFLSWFFDRAGGGSGAEWLGPGWLGSGWLGSAAAPAIGGSGCSILRWTCARSPIARVAGWVVCPNTVGVATSSTGRAGRQLGFFCPALHQDQFPFRLARGDGIRCGSGGPCPLFAFEETRKTWPAERGRHTLFQHGAHAVHTHQSTQTILTTYRTRHPSKHKQVSINHACRCGTPGRYVHTSRLRRCV